MLNGSQHKTAPESPRDALQKVAKAAQATMRPKEGKLLDKKILKSFKRRDAAEQRIIRVAIEGMVWVEMRALKAGNSDEAIEDAGFSVMNSVLLAAEAAAAKAAGFENWRAFEKAFAGEEVPTSRKR